MPANYLPNLKYLPEPLGSITAKTMLNDGVSLGTFLINTNLDHITNLNERKNIARNLLPHAQLLYTIRNSKLFNDYQFVVVEGFYKPAPQEQMTKNDTNHNFLATKGRAVVYELRKNGVVDNDKTFALAKFIQTFYNFQDNLALDYDTFNQSELNLQIAVQTPEIPISYVVNFKNNFNVVFNGQPQASNQAVEITERPETTTQFPAPTADGVTGFFCVGDLHARLVSFHGGDPWQSYARDTRTSKDEVIIENIKKIKSGSVVVISAGFNDTTKTNDTPQSIAERVKAIVKTSTDLNHTVTFLLFPVTSKADIGRNTLVRQAINSELGTLNVRLFDLDQSQFSLSNDGISLTDQNYITIASSLL